LSTVLFLLSSELSLLLTERLNPINMIGVLADSSQRKFVEEFFELFKTPWEPFQEKKSYHVVVTTRDSLPPVAGCLTFICTAARGGFDTGKSRKFSKPGHPIWIEYGRHHLPIYGDLRTFQQAQGPLAHVSATHEPVCYVLHSAHSKIIRIGYDIFYEIEYLLTQGQPPGSAHVPTLDLHIAMLRNCILDSGIPLIEIPPCPYGHNYTVCLTHDVDFLAIRDHLFDHSLAGFLSRIFSPLFQRNMKQQIPWSRLFKNIKAAFSLPLVYAGLTKDIWFDLDRYTEIEEGIRSTFFFIPFRDQPGSCKSGPAPKYRAARYDVARNKKHIEKLLEKGHEIGLHGIDAWLNIEKAIAERETIKTLTSGECLGVRMHWLYFDINSARILEKAGFHYDSTRGYNETVGYLTGTAQVFLLPGTSNTYELPLHVMDTSLFSGKRGRLHESSAFERCNNLCNYCEKYGGVLTINWHTRSLNPERNWDDFYLYLLEYLRSRNVWFAGARQAVEWFKLRRSVQFESVEWSTNNVKLALNTRRPEAGEDLLNLPKLRVRAYKPTRSASTVAGAPSRYAYAEMPWHGEPQLEIMTTDH